MVVSLQMIAEFLDIINNRPSKGQMWELELPSHPLEG